MKEFFEVAKAFLESDLFKGYWGFFIVMVILICGITAWIVNMYYTKIYVPKELAEVIDLKRQLDATQKEKEILNKQNLELSEEIKKVEVYQRMVAALEADSKPPINDGLRQFVRSKV